MATHSHYTQIHGAETLSLAETVLYCVFWAAGLVVPSNGFRCRTHQWNMDLVGKDFCSTWKEINCASNPSNKDTRTFLQKQTLSNSYFNSKSGCCPILRKIHDSTTATNPPEFWGRVDIVDIVDIRVDIRISKNPDV